MVDLDDLDSRPLNKVITSEGYICQGCGAWEAVFHTSISLEETLRTVNLYPPGHPKFLFLFQKAVRKAQGIHERGEAYGTLRRTDLATAR